MDTALDLAAAAAAAGEAPVGAVIVESGEILAAERNRMRELNDPTAHAELQALRAAAHRLASTRLDGCVVYASGQPCPMCLAAIHLCGVSRVLFAASNAEGAPFGLSTADVYAQLAQPLEAQRISIQHLPQAAMQDVYARWRALRQA